MSPTQGLFLRLPRSHHRSRRLLLLPHRKRFPLLRLWLRLKKKSLIFRSFRVTSWTVFSARQSCQSRGIYLPVHDGDRGPCNFVIHARLIVAGYAAETARNIMAQRTSISYRNYGSPDVLRWWDLDSFCKVHLAALSCF